MVDPKYLLTSLQMAEFVHNGYLTFDELIPKDVCEELYRYIDTHPIERAVAPGPLSEAWHPDHPCHKAYVANPGMQGILHSLVGPNCRYDHHHPHKTTPKSSHKQGLHQDAEYDTRFGSFDIQISIFPQDTPVELGGTRFLPGSHFRRVYVQEVSRYDNVRGMVQCVCKAGTVVVWHHNLWHGAQPNLGDINRYMVKLRVNPTVRQQLLWNTADLADPAIHGWMNRAHAWWGVEGRLEMINKIRLWRSLTGQPDWDSAMWLTRIESNPTTLYLRDQYSPLRPG
jgi:hypothetical protein